MLPKIVTVLLLSLLQPACQPQTQSTSRASETPEWSKRFWFDKARRSLLPGASALSLDEETRLLALPREAIVDALMSKPEFSNAVLDFNMYFLGSRVEKLVDRQGLTAAADTASSALNAAVELARGGDYFTLFRWRQDYSSFQDIDFASIVQEGVPSTLGLKTPQDFRRYWINQARGDVQRLHQVTLQSNGTRQACRLLVDANRADLYSNLLLNAGLPDKLIRLFRVNFHVESRCGALGIDFEMTPGFRAMLQRELKTLEQNLTALPSLIADLPATRAQTVQDLFILPFDKLAPQTTVLDQAFDDRLWAELPNFSTNYNRRRAAYVLKTYFCDDLTPINIVAAATHTDSKHASDSSCAACHYKLDPMAGFFRTRGMAGAEFQDPADFSMLLHDDFALRDGPGLNDYLNEWRSPSGSVRAWNVGYIRSATKEQLNAYGESLDDLFQIIREARESKTCLTRRMAEYVLGSDQIYDGGWIEFLAQDFHKASAESASPGASSQAFKNVYKALVLSESFSRPDREPGVCYDFRPGAKSSTLPCAVASIVQKNCASCHSGEGAAAGLDLSTWDVSNAGEGGRFPHRDAGTGVQLSKGESFQRISHRLSTSDPALLMPLMRHMDAVDRATLYKWVTFELAGVAE